MVDLDNHVLLKGDSDFRDRLISYVDRQKNDHGFNKRRTRNISAKKRQIL